MPSRDTRVTVWLSIIAIAIVINISYTSALSTISGRIPSVNDQSWASITARDRVVIAVYRPRIYHGKVQTMTTAEVYAGVYPYSAIVNPSDGTWSVANVAQGTYTLFAFGDKNKNNKLDLSSYESCGWYSNDDTFWMASITIDGVSSYDNYNISLHSIDPFPTQSRTVPNGWLRQVKGQTVLSVAGTPSQRGFAHGALLAPYILKFFRFFTLEATVTNIKQYTTEIIPFIQTYHIYPDTLLAEIDAIIAGMSSVGPIPIPELGRDFNRWDLLYQNMYGTYPEFSNATMNPLRESKRACTQFSFWGQNTRGTDVDGGTITGRNMDGENDFRKITVANFLSFSVDPIGENKYVHFMWPGFIMTASGMNQHGVYLMMNDGQSNPQGPLAKRVYPDPYVQRMVLATATRVADIKAIMDKYRCDTGGICGNGCNLMFAQPYTPDMKTSTAAMVYEGDRLGDVFRLPAQFEPFSSEAIMASNHFVVYGYDPAYPLNNFGRQVYFSSLWRFEAGKNMVNAKLAVNQPFGTPEMVQLLKTVSHATTEHAVITRPNKMEIDLAVADMRTGGWYGPYLNWTSFKFTDFFPK